MAVKRIYYADFRRALERDAFKPAYVFTGAEQFSKEQGIQAIVEKALLPTERSLNLEYLYAGADVSGQDLRTRAETLPFLASYRVLVVRQIEKWRPADVAQIDTYLERPSNTSILVLASTDEHLKTAAWKSLLAKAMHVECYPLFDNQVPGWIERRAAEHGKKISREAVNLMIERTGQDLYDLENEMIKLAIYTAGKTEIEEKDVAEVSGLVRQNTVHDLNTALGRADAHLAIRLVGQVLSEDIAPQQLLGALAWHFRNLHTAHIRREAGESLEQVAQHLRHPEARREFQSQIETYPQDAFSEIFLEFHQLDEKLKTGKGHWALWLEMALLRICGLSRSSRLKPV